MSTPLLFPFLNPQLEALARVEVEHLVDKIDAARESLQQAQDELLMAQV